MSKNRTKISLLILFCLSLLSAAPIKIQWRQLETPSEENLDLVKMHSKQDFWVAETKPPGRLFHYKDSQWHHFSPPKIGPDVKQLHYHIINEHHFLCATVNSQYFTDFYDYQAGKWNKLSLSVKVPVRYFFTDKQGNIWIYGDWGWLSRYQKGSLQLIKAPFENHLTALAQQNNGNLWIGVRNEGIYRRTDSTYFNVPIADSIVPNISHIVADSNDIRFYTFDGKIYQQQHNKFLELKQQLPASNRWLYNFRDPEHGVAFSGEYAGEIHLYIDQKWFYYPLPLNYRVIEAHIFKDDAVIVSDLNGYILMGTPREKTFFSETAGRYHLDGSIYDQSDGAAFIYFNDDEYLDLFLMNRGAHQQNRLHLNSDGRDFADISEQCPLLKTKRISRFHFGDLNRDGRNDIVVTDTSNYLNILLNDRRGHYYLFRQLDLGAFDEIKDIRLIDYNRDGFLDICLSAYYRGGRSIGANLLFENKFYGLKFTVDTAFITQTKGWNNSTTFADFNNDGYLEAYISTSWIKDKLLSFKNNQWHNQSELSSSSIEITQQNSVNTIAIDYDNDGDLDLFLNHPAGLTCFKNNGLGQFRKASDSLLAPVALPEGPFAFINSGDFNNDGYLDLFISVNNIDRNFLLLNDSAQCFIDASQDFGLSSPAISSAIIGDIDQDGDLDIYGLRKYGTNILWINRTDNKNYLKVKLNGLHSINGRFSKIWVYSAGYLDEPEHLLGYREIGTLKPAEGLYNSDVAHFGLNRHNKYDLRITFQAGKTITLEGISAGQTLQVAEYGPLGLFIRRLPALVLFFLQQAEFYFYTLIFLLTAVILYLGIRMGVKYFRWELPFSVVIMIFNLSLFWFLVNLFRNDNIFDKYFLPVMAAALGIIIPLIYSALANRRRISGYLQNTKTELLKTLLNFTHGKYALSNINSLYLLCNNLDKSVLHSERLKVQFSERHSTFLNFVLPQLDKLIHLARSANLDQDMIKKMRVRLHSIRTDLDHFLNNLESGRITECKKMAADLKFLRDQLRYIKSSVFKEFSAEATQVILDITRTCQQNLPENQVEIKRKKEEQKNYWVLIPAHELGDIINNCLQNALQAVASNKGKKRIEIYVYRSAPKIRIDISDNGSGIPEEIKEKIFTSGFSSTGGTGQGLYHNQNVLNKYGGRIYLVSSRLGQGANFRIELLEGVHR